MTSRLEEVNLPSPGWLVSFEGWCRRGDSASVSGAGRLGTWWHQEPNQPWSQSPCCQAHAQSPYLPLWLLCKCTLISVIPQGRQVFFQFRILARLVRGQFQKLLLDLPTHPTGQGTKVGLLPTTKYIHWITYLKTRKLLPHEFTDPSTITESQARVRTLFIIYTPSHFALIEVTGDPTDASSQGINVSLYAVHISPWPLL